MKRRKIVAALGLAACGLLLISSAPAEAQEKPIQIGMAKTFFNDVPKVFVDIATGPFSKVMKTATNLDGALQSGDEPMELAKKLNAGAIHFGVFNSFEFAWAKKQYPALEPILVAPNVHNEVRAYVIVQKNCPAKSLKDLRGCTFDLPMGAKQICKVFVDRETGDNAQMDNPAFFGKTIRSKSGEAALDDVCRGNSQATVVDTIALAMYKDIKNAIFDQRLRILEQSESLPPAVIAYKKGGIDEASLEKFRQGLLKAHESRVGRDMMDMLHIKGFQPVPADYSARLAATLKAYPAP